MTSQTLRWSLEIRERDAGRKGDLQDYFRNWLVQEARARKLRLLNIADLRMETNAYQRSILLVADVTVEPLPSKEEREQEKERARGELKARLEYMQARYQEEAEERGLRDPIADKMAEIMARGRAVEAQLEEDKRRVALQERWYRQDVGEIIEGRPAARASKAAKPEKPTPQPPPTPAVRRLDLDEATPVALPAQKGRVIDLE